MGGFECTYAKVEQNKRLDLLVSTRHDQKCREDYQLLKELGIWTVREGLAWSQIDQNGKYDFSKFEEMMRIGQEEKIQQLWDLNHFDYPDDLDPFSKEFIERFRTYAVEAVKTLRHYSDQTLYLCPINEISFFAFIAGDVGAWAPYQKDRGLELKKQLVLASIAAMDAVWDQDSNVRFLQVDPIFSRVPQKPITRQKRKVGHEFAESKFQAWDMLSGKIFPELGGHPKYLDILGCNYYYYNQEWITAVDAEGKSTYKTIPLYSKHRIMVGTMLKEVYLRYKRPLLISETGGWGELRPKWWKKLFKEIDKVRKRLPIYGVCIYPIVDRADWSEGHLTNSGLWDYASGDELCQRVPHHPTIDLIQKYIKKEQSLQPVELQFHQL